MPDSLTRDEAVHHLTGHGQPFRRAAQTVGLGGGKDRRAGDLLEEAHRHPSMWG
jgi:hypothetical protein